MTGTLEAIWIKRARKGPMEPVARALALAGRGLVDNANQGGARQVSVIERRAWDAAAAAVGEPGLDPRFRRANLMVDGVDLADSLGRILSVGAVRIRIRGATRPCRRMDAARPGLGAALAEDGRGGVYGEVLDDGEITVGDPVGLSHEA